MKWKGCVNLRLVVGIWAIKILPHNLNLVSTSTTHTLLLVKTYFNRQNTYTQLRIESTFARFRPFLVAFIRFSNSGRSQTENVDIKYFQFEWRKYWYQFPHIIFRESLARPPNRYITHNPWLPRWVLLSLAPNSLLPLLPVLKQLGPQSWVSISAGRISRTSATPR